MENHLRYLVTGATGFIGPYLIRHIVSRGDFCRCLVRKPDRLKIQQSENTQIIQGDITRPETLKGIAEGIDCVLHLATLGHASNFKVPSEAFHSVNVIGTQNILHEAVAGGVSRMVHCSSVAAMGICEDNPATEMSRCRPHHPYGKSKLEAESIVRETVRNHPLQACILRFSMVYGPGDWRDMLKLTRLAKKGLFPKIGNRPKLTPLIHVDDAVGAILLAAAKGKPGETYLVTNNRSEPFDRIRTILQHALGVRRLPLYVPEWAALTASSILEKTFSWIGKPPPVTRKNIESTLADRVFSIEKAQRDLGFAPSVDPAVGLAQTVRWYMDNNWV